MWRWSLLSILLWMAVCSLEAQLTWLTPANISLAGQNALAPQVCFTPEGYSNVIWSRSNGTNFVIQTSVSSIAGTWWNPQKLSYIGANAFFPQIVTDKNGNTTAVWSRYGGANYLIQSSFKKSHQDWGAPVTLSGTGPGHDDATKPQIGLDPQGLHIAIWQKNNGINNVIQVAQKRADGSWSKPVNLTLANPSGLGDIEPQIAVDDKGNALAVWINDSTSTIRGAIRQVNGKWSAPFDLSEADQSVSSPCVAFDGNGTATVIWTRSDGTNYIVQTTSQQTNGQWSPPLNLSLSGENSIQPQLAVDNFGNKVAIWHRFDGANTIVQAAVQPVGGNWLNPVDISQAGQDASEPQVKIDPFGTIVAIWRRSDGQNFIVQSATSLVGSSSWTQPVSLSAPGEDAMNPQLALSNRGDAVVAWLRSDGSNSIVQAIFGIKTREK